MKRLLMWAVFVVTWTTYKPGYDANSFGWNEGRLAVTCVVQEAPQRKEVPNKLEAEKLVKELKKDKKNWDVKYFEMNEVK